MINKEEFEEIVCEVNSQIQSEFKGVLPEVTTYDVVEDGADGMECILSMPPGRKVIAVNYSALITMYPYMDKESITAMLISMIRRTGMEF